MPVIAEWLLAGRAAFIRHIKPKPDAIHCDECGGAGTVLFSAYFTWMPVSGHISSSSIPENEKVLYNERKHPIFTKIGKFHKDCLLRRIARWEDSTDEPEV